MLPHIRLSLEVSSGIVSEAVRTKSVSFSRLSTLADFLVMIATWFHDLNYAPTRRLALERDLLTRLRRQLPDTEGIEDLFAGIGEAMSKKKETI
jgi:hypothetical protein